ncbi:MAG: serine/threonine protein kinase [Deltaproteobacteria bacterium]|nr:serine/threonine protein kinase [Deltaproteobacteria bacterium]
MELFGRFVLLERIGAGGMAEVFRAVMRGDSGFVRTVAVKRILPSLSQDSEAARMLVEEANLAAAIDHPNVVKVLDLGRHGDCHFMAMEYLVGATLAEVLRTCLAAGTPLPQAMVVHILAQVLRGLAHAHSLRDATGRPLDIIHRDVAPENVMVCFDGRAVLMDFGVARAADRARLTLAGSLRGRPAYMSPEVVRGDAVTQALDLYAAAVLLHEALSMRPMRNASSDVQMLTVVARGGFPTFESLGVTVPPPLAAVVYRALQDDPRRRFPDAGAFLGALEGAANVLDWRWTADDTARFLAERLAEVREREARAEARWHGWVQKIRTASPRKLSRLVAEVNGQAHARWPLVAGGAVGAALLAAGAWAAWPAPPPPPAAVVAPPPPPKPPPARVVLLQTEPDGARVTVAGTPRGEAPLNVSVPPGAPVEVAVELAGYAVVRRTLSHADAPETLLVKLEPLAGATGTLSLQTTPWGKVYVDGKDTGQFTPLKSLELSAGKHRIRVRNTELGVAADFEVDIAPGRNQRVSRRLN